MERPISELMETAMHSIKDLVDVSTVIGDPVAAAGGVTVIPVSKVSFGYVTGGSDLPTADKRHAPHPDPDFPFAGGSGAGVSVQPVGFLVIEQGSVRVLPAQSLTVADRMVELLPGVVSDVKRLLGRDPSSPGVM